jgi:hypothetical protein
LSLEAPSLEAPSLDAAVEPLSVDDGVALRLPPPTLPDEDERESVL